MQNSSNIGQAITIMRYKYRLMCYCNTRYVLYLEAAVFINEDILYSIIEFCVFFGCSILLQDKRVPILSPRQQGFDGRDRTESTTSVHSASSGSASAAADTSKALPLRHTSSVFSSLISTVFHAEGVDK